MGQAHRMGEGGHGAPGGGDLRGDPLTWYHAYATEYTPELRAFLEGERVLAEQRAFSEPWITYALFLTEHPLGIEALITNADVIEHNIPGPPEMAWALLRLRGRGWLIEQGNEFGLTSEGRKKVQKIIRRGGMRAQFSRLREWMAANPPP
jgi:hypothetical protein